MSDFLVNLGVLVLASLNLGFNLYHSNPKSPWWWCDPRGLMALPLFLSAAGIPIYYLAFDEYPNLFGLVSDNISIALLYLALANWAFTVGTFATIQKQTIMNVIPPLKFRSTDIARFSPLLIGTIIVVSFVSYYGLYNLDFFSLLSLQYGAGQWDLISSNPWLRASVLGTPLASALLIVWGMQKKSLFSPALLLICLFSLLPAVFLGGRKDAIFIMIAIALASAIKRGANQLKPILYAILIIGTFNYVQAISRDSDSLDIAGRLSSLTEVKKNENSVIGQLSIALPILPTLTAAMTVFPDQQGYYFGLSYLQTIAATALPKVLWGESDILSPNQNFHNAYYPEVVDFSMDYSLAAEGYQNFGLVGVPIAYFMLGVFLSTLKKIALAFGESLWTPIYIVVFEAGMWSLRSDSNTFFKMSFYTATVMLLLFMFSRLKIR